MHEPHEEVSHPTFVPVSPRVSRRKYTRSVRGSTSASRATPLTVTDTLATGPPFQRVEASIVDPSGSFARVRSRCATALRPTATPPARRRSPRRRSSRSRCRTRSRTSPGPAAMRTQKHSPVSALAEPVHAASVASTLTTSGSFELWSGSISSRSSTSPSVASGLRSASASEPRQAEPSAASAALRRFACAYATAPVRATGRNTSTSTTSRIPPTTSGRTTFQNPRFEPDTAGRYPGARALT